MAAAAMLTTWNGNWEARVAEALGEVREIVLSSNYAAASAGVGRFAKVLNDCRLQLGPAAWKTFIAENVHKHASFDLFQQDPFTRRSFLKPLGYAGDPGLLDLAFEHPASFAERRAASPVGQFIADISTQGAASRAVRDRRAILAAAIDEAAKRTKSPKILSLASGYLREVELSQAFREHRLSRLVALDHDAKTTEEIRFAYHAPCLEVRHAGPRDLLSRFQRESLGAHFDLVFSAGLFDYLSDRFAGRLLGSMLDLLGPGGRLLVANFVPELPDIGYMEALMDWWLIYRTPHQFWSLVSEEDSHKIAESRTFRDTTGSIVFLELTRR